MASGDLITFKLIILGTINVGKTSLTLRFTDGVFDEEKTQDIDERSKEILVDGQRVKMTITDTAGQERFRTLTSSFYRNADAIIIVFDLTDKDSFDDIAGHITEANRYSHKRAEKFIVGTKSDLPNRAVTAEQAAVLSEQQQILGFMETSAKTGANVETFFMSVAQRLLKSAPAASVPADNGCVVISDSPRKDSKKGGLCSI